ncbi:MAG: hypothetical protein LBR70_05170 [Lactobacillaceae bacterium]|jgi:hypothetical protein|nr:hypothetical protein [Lactobacillaceae bacterium]
MENNNINNVIENYKSSADNTASGKPERLPEKFWDAEKNAIRINELIEDYLSLIERDENLIEDNLRHVPESFDKYDISIDNDFFVRDDDVLKKLHDSGFTNEQAQLVYDLAQEKILPILNDLTVDFEAEKQFEKLISHFGSKERFDEVARQISAWAKQNISSELYDVLGSTYEGVVTLYKMMSSNEPLLSKDNGAKEKVDETALREMMKDPRYWRDKDNSYIEKIRKGFEKLYPETEE